MYGKSPFKEEEKKNGMKVHFRETPRPLKILAIALTVLCILTLGTLTLVRWGIRAEIEDMRQKAAALEQEKADLNDKIGNAGSMQGAEDVARESLGLVDPDTILITPNSHE